MTISPNINQRMTFTEWKSDIGSNNGNVREFFEKKEDIVLWIKEIN